MESPQMIDAGRAIPPATVFTNRIVWAAMIMGQIIFASVIAFVPTRQNQSNVDLPVHVMIGVDAFMLVIGIAVAWLAPKLIINSEANDTILRRQCMTATIVTMAFLEGTAFFGLVIVLLSSTWWPAGAIPAVALLVQLTCFPRAVIKTDS